MKLEEGMYVRSKINGLISRITDIEEFEELEQIVKRYILDNNHDRGFCSTEKDSVKASHNIIDLIEVGDYVNGSLIIEIRDYTYDNIKRIVTERSAMYSVAIREDELLDNLNSIVTKEQFESMSYKVGEE